MYNFFRNYLSSRETKNHDYAWYNFLNLSIRFALGSMQILVSNLNYHLLHHFSNTKHHIILAEYSNSLQIQIHNKQKNYYFSIDHSPKSIQLFVFLQNQNKNWNLHERETLHNKKAINKAHRNRRLCYTNVPYISTIYVLWLSIHARPHIAKQLIYLLFHSKNQLPHPPSIIKHCTTLSSLSQDA